jgi:3-deoxy-D-manno-octulosonate 8-phosphate phosphatase KdsC-like HAD superfamily phosphatase
MFKVRRDKAVRLKELATERCLPLQDIAYIGNDTGCLALAGLSIVVADAHPDVRTLARLTTTAPRGYGEVREICDIFTSVLSNLS